MAASGRLFSGENAILTLEMRGVEWNFSPGLELHIRSRPMMMPGNG